MTHVQTPVQEEKARLRREINVRRKSLSPDYRDGADRVIRERVLALPAYEKAESIFLYVSMTGEPDTRGILERALSDGKRVYVPKCAGKGEMLAVRIRGVSDLKPGAYGIPEPEDCRETAAPGEIDLILTPCVAASRDGARLGHGGGYYDRFLAGSSKNAVCLCYKALLRDDIPVSPTDALIPLVITD